jgi:hypothetical protein
MDLANDITGESRNLIHLMEHHIPDFWEHNWTRMDELHKKLGINIKQEFKNTDIPNCVSIVYGDTDSVNSMSIITLQNLQGNIEQVPIEELFTRNEDNIVKILPNGTEIALCEEKILNWNNTQHLVFNNANYIMRHKVTKPKWKLKTKSGKEIVVTNDHSMIVFRNGSKIEVKPYEIQKDDKILIVT